MLGMKYPFVKLFHVGNKNSPKCHVVMSFTLISNRSTRFLFKPSVHY